MTIMRLLSCSVVDTMQETLVVTLRNPSRRFPREAQWHTVTEAGRASRNDTLTLEENNKNRLS